MLFVFNVLIFTVERWEIYSFFGGGEKGEGKSSFADVAFGAGGAVCKCAFSYGAGLVRCFFFVFGSFIYSDGSFKNVVGSFTNSDASFKNVVGRFINSNMSFYNVGGSFTNSDASF